MTAMQTIYSETKTQHATAQNEEALLDQLHACRELIAKHYAAFKSIESMTHAHCALLDEHEMAQSLQTIRVIAMQNSPRVTNAGAHGRA